MGQVTATQLHQVLTRYYNEGELRTLCFDLSIDYESLGGDGKTGKARELVLYGQRHGRFADIVHYIQQTRPHLDWELPPAVAGNASGGSATPSPSAPSYIFHGNVIGSSFGGNVQAESIVGGDIHMGIVNNADEFRQQLAELQRLVQQALASGEINNERDGATVQADLQAAITEANAEKPNSNRLKRRLEDIVEVLDSSPKTAMQAANMGTALLRATSTAVALLKAVQVLFK